MFRSCIMKLKWTNSNVATSPIFDGLFHVIKSLIILIASFVRGYINNTASEHAFIPEINPHCILSQIYALFIEFYYALFLFFKDMHYNTMIHTFCIATIFLHAHVQVVYYKCVKFHKNLISRLGGVALTRYMDGRTGWFLYTSQT
jgi:hypothetical protein